MGSRECPDDDVLGALVDHALEPSEVAQVTEHLDGCPVCQQVVIAALRIGRAPVPATALPSVRRQFGRYELRGLLGSGGMGTVYDAYDAELDRSVALKVLRRDLSEMPGLAERLVEESRLMAKVAHPSVIAVYDVGRAGTATFVAMELIRGSTLTAWLGSKPWDWRAIVAVFERAGQGLAAAHGAGIVHRDFKPDNVLVSNAAEKVVVTDFGIARAGVPALDGGGIAVGTQPSNLIAELPMATNGAAIGTPAYMSPEQLSARRVDLRADVFAFSVSLWEALFGARPFPGTTPAELFAAMRERLVRPPADARRIPRRLLWALRKGLAFDPSDRWADMPALLGELSRVRARRKHAWLAAGAVGVVGAGIAATIALVPPDPVDRCAVSLAALDDAFKPGLVRAVLAADPATQRTVLTTLTGAAEAWRATQRVTCHADRAIIQDPRVAACLEARRIDLAGVVDELIAGGAAGARYAVRLSGFAGRPSLCVAPPIGALVSLMPADRGLRGRVTAVRKGLIDVRAARERGELAASRDQNARLSAEAKPLWPPVYAEAQLTLGVTLLRMGDLKPALATLLEAAEVAERVHHDEVASQSWVELASAETFDHGNPSRGLEYATYAVAAIDRIGRPASATARAELMKGAVLVELHRLNDAEVALSGALALAHAAGLPATLIGQIESSLGLVYEGQGRYAEEATTFRHTLESLSPTPTGELLVEAAIRHERLAWVLDRQGLVRDAEVEVRRAVEIADGYLSETPYYRPYMHVGFARILLDAGRADQALTEVDHAAEMLARSQGVRSERYAEALQAHGEILTSLGRALEGEPVLARACDILAFTQHDDSAEDTLSCGIAHAAALISLHRDAAALAALDRLVPRLISLYGESHIDVARAVTLRGTARAALGDPFEAIADFARAIAALAPQQIDPGYLASATWRHGAARWSRQPTAARAEIEQAIAAFAVANGRWAHERGEAIAWLALHDRLVGR